MIDEDRIMKELDFLLTKSEPGATISNLHVLTAPIGPLGIPDAEDLKGTFFAIVPDSPDMGAYINRIIARAAVDFATRPETVLFAALSEEVWAVPEMDALAHELRAQGKLETHPAAAELTVVYAVCRDGRRWQSRRWLTGPSAGKTEDVRLLVGQPSPYEGFHGGRILRKLVGL